MKNKIKYLRTLFLILLISNFIVIFIFSSQDGEESSAMSRGIIFNIVKLFTTDTNKIETIIVTIEPIVRKLAHFSIYTLAGIWAICLLETYNVKDEKRIAIGTAIGFLYACSDEFHQSFVGERSPEINDVFIDTLGFVFGIMVVMLVIKTYQIYGKNRKSKMSNHV